MVSDASKKKAAQKKAAAAAKRGGKSSSAAASSSSKSVAAVDTQNGIGVEKFLANGVGSLQISDRTCTGVLCSHPLSRDIRMKAALSEFKEAVGWKFLFMRCWEIMREIPKYSYTSIRLNNMHSNDGGVGDVTGSSPRTPITPRATLNMNDAFVDLEPSIPRPIGKIQASAQQKRKARLDLDFERINSERNQRLDKTNDNFQEFMQVKKLELEHSAKNIEINARRVELKEQERQKRILERDERILYVDTTNFSPLMLAHHHKRCEKLIAARRARNG